MVADQHNVAGMEGCVYCAGGVGDDQRLCAEQAQDAHALGGISHGPAFISVHPALHHGHAFAAKGAEYEAAPVARRGGMFEIGDGAVLRKSGVFHLIAQKTQAGAENQENFGTKVSQLFLQVFCAGAAALVKIGVPGGGRQGVQRLASGLPGPLRGLAGGVQCFPKGFVFHVKNRSLPCFPPEAGRNRGAARAQRRRTARGSGSIFPVFPGILWHICS